MKKLVSLISLVLICQMALSQNSDIAGIKKACTNYIEGFYEGDTLKLKASLQPKLNKFGFWKNKDTQIYNQVGYMSFEQALDFAKDVKDNMNISVFSPLPGILEIST